MSDKKPENHAQSNPTEPKPDEQKHDQENATQEKKSVFNLVKGSVGVMIFVSLWALAGLAAFIYSLYCFTKSGTTAEKILGLILALIAGPFYFIYVAVYKAYCR